MTSKKKKAKAIYIIHDQFRGKDVHCVSPEYKREGGGKFTLNDELSEKDMDYLVDVVKHPGIQRIQPEA